MDAIFAAAQPQLLLTDTLLGVIDFHSREQLSEGTAVKFAE